MVVAVLGYPCAWLHPKVLDAHRFARRELREEYTLLDLDLVLSRLGDDLHGPNTSSPTKCVRPGHVRLVKPQSVWNAVGLRSGKFCDTPYLLYQLDNFSIWTIYP